MTMTTTTYYLDGEQIEVDEFISDNEFDAEEIAEIRSLSPGKSIRFGGGAAALFVLTAE
jgi:hypothetical protein